MAWIHGAANWLEHLASSTRVSSWNTSGQFNTMILPLFRKEDFQVFGHILNWPYSGIGARNTVGVFFLLNPKHYSVDVPCKEANKWWCKLHQLADGTSGQILYLRGSLLRCIPIIFPSRQSTYSRYLWLVTVESRGVIFNAIKNIE